MKIGIIIIFCNNENQIDKDFIISQLNKSKNIELCLVDNNSKDETLSLLLDIKENCLSHISVVEIKKRASENVAKRAGVRFITNQSNLKHIGYINVSKLQKRKSLNGLIESVHHNQTLIVDLNTKTIQRQKMKQTLYKSIFSIVEYLNGVNPKQELLS